MVQPILPFNHPIYSEPSFEARIGPATNALLADLWDTLQAAKLPWLCAKNIGHNVQVAVIDTAFVLKNERYIAPDDFRAVVINPHVVPTTALITGLLEWEASLPQLAISLTRPKAISARWLNHDGIEIEAKLEGYAARAFLHCVELFQGQLMTDNLSPYRKTSLKGHLGRIKGGKVTANYTLANIEHGNPL